MAYHFDTHQPQLQLITLDKNSVLATVSLEILITFGAQKKEMAIADVLVIGNKFFVYFTLRRHDSSFYRHTSEILDMVHHEKNKWCNYAVIFAELVIEYDRVVFCSTETCQNQLLTRETRFFPS